jgi:hypothetical protein
MSSTLNVYISYCIIRTTRLSEGGVKKKVGQGHNLTKLKVT